MGFLHKLAWLGSMLLLCLGQVQAADTEKADSQAAIALLEKPWPITTRMATRPSRRSADRASLSTRTVMSLYWIPRV